MDDRDECAAVDAEPIERRTRRTAWFCVALALLAGSGAAVYLRTIPASAVAARPLGSARTVPVPIESSLPSPPATAEAPLAEAPPADAAPRSARPPAGRATRPRVAPMFAPAPTRVEPTVAPWTTSTCCPYAPPPEADEKPRDGG